MDWLLLAVMGIIFVSTLAGSAFGFGNSMIAVPLLMLVIPATMAVPVATLVATVLAGMVVVQDRKYISFGHVRGLLLASILGVPFGLFLLLRLPDLLVKSILAVLIMAFALYLLAQPKVVVAESRTSTGMAGFISGVLGGAYGMTGPPLVVYGTWRGWGPQKFRATLQAYFFPSSLIILLSYYVADIWTSTVSYYGLLSVPGVIVATLLGRAINRRFSPAAFRVLMCTVLLLLGLGLLVQALFLL